jgi:hypothetical protein
MLNPHAKVRPLSLLSAACPPLPTPPPPTASAPPQHTQRETEAEEAGEATPEEYKFDSNCITPGTEFMARLGKHLHFFLRKKMSEDPVWQTPLVIFSGGCFGGGGGMKGGRGGGEGQQELQGGGRGRCCPCVQCSVCLRGWGVFWGQAPELLPAQEDE